MLADDRILAYTNRIRQLASTLKSMGVEIDDKEMAMAVLNGLPERFNNLISALDALGNENETFSLELVKSRLLQEEQRINMRLETSRMKTEASTLVSARRSRQFSYHKCSDCGKDGHPSERCWEMFPDLAQESWKTRKKKSSGSEIVTNYSMPDKIMENLDHVCLLFSSSSSGVTTKSEFWIIDSGCTSYTTFDRSAFSSYTQVLGQTVQMAPSYCPVAGKAMLSSI